MPRARWWVIGGLSLLTALVVLLDVSGVIFTDPEPPAPPPPLAIPQPAGVAVVQPLQPLPAPPERAAVRRVERLLASADLGSSVHAVVAPLATPTESWLDLDGGALATPASTVKLWTAAAVLDAIPAESRLVTTTTWDAADETVTIVGAGDATLATDPAADAASLPELAELTARRLSREADDLRVRVAYDSTAFSGPEISPQWEPTYVTSGVIAPVTALMVDQGRVDPGSDARWPQPDLAAAEQFAQLLEQEGVAVRGEPVPSAGQPGEELASVRSPQVGELVERMLRDSDNQLAESLGRLAAAASGRPASFEGATESIRAVADASGADLVDADLYDASGLSRDDAIPTESLVAALSLGGTDPPMAPLLSGLPVAGFDGTLAERFLSGSSAGAGVVRAKTGTLTGITAEAGVVTTCGGTLVAFAFVADEVPDTESARSVLDEAAAALARCPGGP